MKAWNKKTEKILMAGAVGILLAACVQDDYQGPDPNLPSRTMVVYLGGDNVSLSATLKDEVEEMRKSWGYTGNRCLIYTDPVDDVPRLLSLRGGCKVYPTPFVDTLAVYEEENSASAPVLARVIKEVTELFPADSYGLLFSSHSSGWLPAGTLKNPNGAPRRSLGQDAHTDAGTAVTAEMELADFAGAIPDGMFDFIVFESCFTAGVEVAYALRKKADYLLVSSAELVVPGFVPVDAEAFSSFFHTRTSVEQVLKQFGETYFAYVDRQTGNRQSATLSLLKTDRMDSLAVLVKEGLARSVPVWQPSEEELQSLQAFDRPGSYGDYPAAHRFFDFEAYLQRALTQEYSGPVLALLPEIVVWKAATDAFMPSANGFAISAHCGLTTYVEQSVFPFLNEAYQQTDWYKAIH